MPSLRPAFLPSSLNLFLPLALAFLCQPTCVGLRYGKKTIPTLQKKSFVANLFSRTERHQIALVLRRGLLFASRLNVSADFPTETALKLKRCVKTIAWLFPFCQSPTDRDCLFVAEYKRLIHHLLRFFTDLA